jgi:16S rRNA (guanine527-N7)-methyltransferase
MRRLATPEELRGRIERVLVELGHEADGATLERAGTFLDLVLAWNERMDLTAARNVDELVDLFFADAAEVATLLPPERKTLIDVGSGAGAPAIPLAIMCPHLELTLVEPRSKRVAFLRSVLGTLGRPDVRVVRGRSTEVESGRYASAISRATLSPEEWLREGARLATESVWVLLARAEPPMLAGFSVRHDVEYRWPLTGAERRLLCFEREATTTCTSAGGA